MNVKEGVQLVRLIDLTDSHARNRAEGELVLAGEQVARILSATTFTWARDLVDQAVAAGRKMTTTDVVAAWNAEAARRINAVVAPPAPVGFTDEQYIVWERARRRELVAGATPDSALLIADRATGAPRRLAIAAAPTSDRSAAMERTLEKFEAWGRRQQRAQWAAEHPDDTTDDMTDLDQTGAEL